MPRSLKRIGTLAFDNCIQLKLIEFGGTVAEWKSVEKANRNRWDFDTFDYVVNCTGGAALPSRFLCEIF